MCLYTSLYVEAVLRLYLLTVRVSLRSKKRIMSLFCEISWSGDTKKPS